MCFGNTHANDTNTYQKYNEECRDDLTWCGSVVKTNEVNGK